MSVSIEIDKASQANLNKQFEALKSDTEGGLYRALVKVLMKIKTEAQLRLTGKGHIVTARLKNSIYVKMKTPYESQDNSRIYADKNGQTFNSDLKSVSVNDLEGAVGTNVEYGDKIETLDSYLYWAMKNVDITQTVAQDLQNDKKIGKYLKR